MGRRCRIVVGVVAAVIALLGVRGSAAVIPLGNSGWEAVFDNGLDPFVNIVVDSESSTAVFITKSANFAQPPGPGGFIPSIDIVFRQTRATTVTNIVLNSEIITNSSGVPWASFRFLTVNGANEAAFDPVATGSSGGPPPIGFSIAPFTTAAFSAGNQVLDVGGGIVPNGTNWLPGSGPGDGQLWIATVPHAVAPFTQFVLKEIPAIPEPAGLGLSALVALATRRRRC